MSVYWMDGLRVSFGRVGFCLRFNFGRSGYAYWERSGKHGVIEFWLPARKNGNA
jgi:hypothetical protein